MRKDPESIGRRLARGCFGRRLIAWRCDLAWLVDRRCLFLTSADARVCRGKNVFLVKAPVGEARCF